MSSGSRSGVGGGEGPSLGYVRFLPRADFWWKSVEPVRYEKLAAGATGCASGKEIASMVECARAARLLGLAPRKRLNGVRPDLPSNCGVKGEPPTVLGFNAGGGDHGHADISPLCRVSLRLSPRLIAEELTSLAALTDRSASLERSQPEGRSSTALTLRLEDSSTQNPSPSVVESEAASRLPFLQGVMTGATAVVLMALCVTKSCRYIA